MYTQKTSLRIRWISYTDHLNACLCNSVNHLLYKNSTVIGNVTLGHYKQIPDLFMYCTGPYRLDTVSYVRSKGHSFTENNIYNFTATIYTCISAKH